MGQINMGEVIAGGLLAGLILNIGETILNVPLLGSRMESALRLRNLPPVGGGAIGGFVVGCFVLGFVLVWLYAAMRPRFGAGPGTAIKAALVLWILAFAWPTFSEVMMGFMPMKLSCAAAAWGFGEVIVASLAGAWLYKES